jgi:membrane protein implicated in regulation of membrane protease activity
MEIKLFTFTSTVSIWWVLFLLFAAAAVAVPVADVVAAFVVVAVAVVVVVVVVLMRKSRSRRPSEYEIVEKSRSPHDDFKKKQSKLAFFCFPKIISSIYIAFIRRK